MIEIKDLAFSYDVNRVILKKVSAEFIRGKTYAIYGPSGSGKSTLLKLLGGIEAPSEGSILIDGQNLADLDGSQIRSNLVSFIFQDYLLFPFLTAVENVELAFEICNPKYRGKTEMAKRLLNELELKDILFEKKVKFLSGGEQQRVGIARALASGVPYILADEPTGNLDKETASSVFQLLKKTIKEHNKCCIIVTHSEMIRAQTDDRFLLDDGYLLQEAIYE